MRHYLKQIAITILAILVGLGAWMPAFAAEPEVRVIVPDVPNGVIVSNCYQAVGPIYDRYTFDFCLKQLATYRVRGGGARCDGRLNWNVSGVEVVVKLRKTSCGNGVAWSADSMRCRPSILLGFLAALLKQDRPLLDNLICDYKPTAASGEEPISFIAHRR